MSNLEIVGLITLWVLGILLLCAVCWGPILLWEAHLDRKHNAEQDAIRQARIDGWAFIGIECDSFGNPIPVTGTVPLTPEAEAFLKGTHDRYGQEIHPGGSQIVPGRFVTPGHSAILVKPLPDFPPALPGCCGMHGGACTPDPFGDCDS